MSKEWKQINLMLLIIFFAMIFLAFAPSTMVAYTPLWILIGAAFSSANICEKFENTNNISEIDGEV